jgi:hypothetical protein
MPAEQLTGGCLCGAIRYEIDRVFDVMYCHCSRCRKATGAAALAYVLPHPDKRRRRDPRTFE